MKKYSTALALLVTGTLAMSLTACGGSTGANAQVPATQAQVRLPASFPTKEVPLLSGTLLVAAGDAAEGWSVTVDPTEGDLKAAESALEAAGFNESRVTKGSAMLQNSQYTVAVQSPGKTVTYLVTAK
ncbi:hypothetical protein [Leifsonia sp. 2MCAF36]|uniref:hypothetical protein n=1 Tax=Leifsonia sp. 2MCAF36 TaxID=3232988 RepID=UPI003F950BCE